MWMTERTMARTIFFTVYGFSLIILLLAARPVNAVSLKMSARLRSRFIPVFMPDNLPEEPAMRQKIIPCFNAAILGSFPGRLIFSTSMSGSILLSSSRLGARRCRTAEGDTDFLASEIRDFLGPRKIRIGYRAVSSSDAPALEHEHVVRPFVRVRVGHLQEIHVAAHLGERVPVVFLQPRDEIFEHGLDAQGSVH